MGAYSEGLLAYKFYLTIIAMIITKTVVIIVLLTITAISMFVTISIVIAPSCQYLAFLIRV